MCVEQQRQWKLKALFSVTGREAPLSETSGRGRFKEKKGSEKIIFHVNTPLKCISKSEIKCGKSPVTRNKYGMKLELCTNPASPVGGDILPV